jgi:CelD/BcsL family acetyltransferase involved in cellulose biosynthesis
VRGENERPEEPEESAPRTATVTAIDPAIDPSWDRYVASHPQGRSYHLSASLANLEAAYRCKPAHLALRCADGELRGVLPLLEKRGLVSGRRVWSLPAVPVAGPLADGRTGLAALLSAGRELARGRRRQFVVESADGRLAELEPMLARSEQAPSLVLELPTEGLDEWLRSRSRNLRRNIRKAQEGSLRVRDDGGPDDLETFYRLYDASLRAKGILPRPRGTVGFGASNHLPPVFRLFVLEDAGRPVGGLLCQTLGDSLDLMVIASEAAVQQLRPHHALYMRAIEWASERGLRQVDFGRPAADSHGEFKESWGAAPVPCFVYRHPPDRRRTDTGDRTDGRAWVRRMVQRTPLPLLSGAASLAYRYL